jgi:hypothetical protein
MLELIRDGRCDVAIGSRCLPGSGASSTGDAGGDEQRRGADELAPAAELRGASRCP